MVPSISTIRSAEDVVGGDPVLEAVRAAGVHGDVAADGAGELARRIGGIEEAAMGDSIGDVDVGDAGLNPRAAVFIVDVEDAIEAGEAEHDRIGRRQGPAGQ